MIRTLTSNRQIPAWIFRWRTAALVDWGFFSPGHQSTSSNTRRVRTETSTASSWNSGGTRNEHGTRNTAQPLGFATEARDPAEYLKHARRGDPSRQHAHDDGFRG